MDLPAMKPHVEKHIRLVAKLEQQGKPLLRSEKRTRRKMGK